MTSFRRVLVPALASLSVLAACAPAASAGAYDSQFSARQLSACKARFGAARCDTVAVNLGRGRGCRKGQFRVEYRLVGYAGKAEGQLRTIVVARKAVCLYA